MKNNVSFAVAVLSGLRWSALARISKALFSVVVIIVLARLLSPKDFGLVAMASVFTGISLVFIDLGTGAALIREENPSKNFISTIFWLNVSLSAVVWLVLMLIAPWIADLYDEKIIQALVYLLSVNTLFSGVTVTFKALLEKELRFQPLAVAQIVSQILGSTLGISAAYLGYGVWSLVWMAIVSQFSYSAIVIISGRFGIRRSFNLHYIERIFSFSSYLTLTQLLSHVQRRAELFVVAYYMGSHLGGIYSQTHILLRKPVKLINGLVSPVLFSAMSSVKEERNKIRFIYLNATQSFALVYLPLSVILFLFSEPLIILFLGEKWLEINELLPLFGVMIVYMSLHKNDVLVLKSLGKVEVLFKMYSIYLLLSIGGCLIGVNYGLFGVALSLALSGFALYITGAIVTTRLIDVGFRTYFGHISRLLVYGTLMLIIGFLLKTWAQDSLGESIVLSTILTVSATVFVYIALLVARPVPACDYLLSLLGLGSLDQSVVKS